MTISETKRIKGYTYKEALTELELARNALHKAFQAQSYTVGSRSLTRANVSNLKDMVDYYSKIVSAFENGGGSPHIQKALPQDY